MAVDSKIGRYNRQLGLEEQRGQEKNEWGKEEGYRRTQQLRYNSSTKGFFQSSILGNSNLIYNK